MSNYYSLTPEYYTVYLERFKVSPPLLDMGAGYGLLMQLATTRGIDCYGVEFEQERVDDCIKRGLKVVQHDLGNRLPFPDNMFGMIYCGQVIEHLPPPAQAMMTKEAYRVLKPGGQFQICSPCRHSEVNRVMVGHDYILTPKELLAMLKTAGFETIKDINYPQKIPEMPPEVVKEIWEKYRPDLLSESASFFCTK